MPRYYTTDLKLRFSRFQIFSQPIKACVIYKPAKMITVEKRQKQTTTTRYRIVWFNGSVRPVRDREVEQIVGVPSGGKTTILQESQTTRLLLQRRRGVPHRGAAN